jgi:hypothetical protein
MRVVRSQRYHPREMASHGEPSGAEWEYWIHIREADCISFVYFSWGAGVLEILGQWGAALCIRSRHL